MFRRFLLSAVLAIPLLAPSLSAQTASADLKLVPADAALFGYVDVAKLLKSKVGEAIRNLEAPADDGDAFEKKADATPDKMTKPYADFRKQFLDATGIDIETIQSATFFVPKFKGPGDESTFVLALTLPAYDQTKLLTGLAKISDSFKDPKVVGPGLVEFPRAGRLLFPSDTRIVFAGNQVKTMPTERSGMGGVISPALEAAASGKTAVLSLNFANFPEEIKGDDLPAEVRPFAPLIKSDLNYATFDLEGDSILATVRIRNETRAKTIDAEKSLAALVNFAKTGLAVAAVQIEKEKEKNKQLEPIVGLIANLQAAVKTAKYSSDETEAKLDVKMKADVSVTGTIFAAMTSARTASARSITQNNLKQIGLAMHNYESAMGTLPPAAICDKNGKPLLSWRVAILPYIEQDNLYKQFKLDEPWDSEHNKKLAEYRIKVYSVPGENLETKTRYRVFVGGDGKVEAGFNWKKGIRIPDFTDGTSNTALVVLAKDPVIWTKPDELNYDSKINPASLIYFQNNVTPVGFCDGSVRMLSNKVSAETWRAIITRNGGEVVAVP